MDEGDAWEATTASRASAAAMDCMTLLWPSAAADADAIAAFTAISVAIVSKEVRKCCLSRAHPTNDWSAIRPQFLIPRMTSALPLID